MGMSTSLARVPQQLISLLLDIKTIMGGNGDAFLAKFNSSGIRQWATYYGGSANESGLSCSTDQSGNVFLAGVTSSISSIASGGYQNTYGGNGDVFLVKFNSSGIRLWATYYGGSGIENEDVTCATDGTGNVYLASFTNSSDGIAAGGYQSEYNGGSYDAFLVKFNSNGDAQFGMYYGGPSTDYGYTVALSGNGTIYLAGSTMSTTGIASNGFQNTYATIPGQCCDAFLVKFGFECEPSSGADVVTACDSHLWIDGSTYTSSNSSATHVIYDEYECDSTVTLDLTILHSTFSMSELLTCESVEWNGQLIEESGLYTFITENADGCDSTANLDVTLFQAPQASFEYATEGLSVVFTNTSTGSDDFLWDFGNDSISDLIDPTHTYEDEGEFLVCLSATNPCGTEEFCVELSLSNIVTGVSIAEDELSLLPNPSNSIFNLVMKNASGAVQIIVTDNMGREVLMENFSATGNSARTIDMSGRASGIYFLSVQTENGAGVVKLVKE
jgi:hypothetical protein